MPKDGLKILLLKRTCKYDVVVPRGFVIVLLDSNTYIYIMFVHKFVVVTQGTFF